MPLIETPKSLLLDKGQLIKLQTDKTDLFDAETEYTNICTGFGVDHEIPVRIAVYALPVLQMGEKFLRAQTEFYVAKAFATKLNGLDANKVQVNIALIKEYIKLFKTELSVVNSPVWLDERDPFEVQRYALIKELAKILREHGSERIIRFADSRNGDESLAYIASHALYMWDTLDVDEDKFIIERDASPQSLLMVGGPAEKLFFEARQLLLSHFPTVSTRSTVQGFTELGRRPPYYAVDSEMIVNGRNNLRIGFEEIMSIADPDALRDSLYLIISLSETLTFDDIPRVKKGQIKPQELEDMTSACNKLQKIIAQLRS